MGLIESLKAQNQSLEQVTEQERSRFSLFGMVSRLF